MGPQFSWIEANLLRFFLVDVRNSRGKFDEIKRWNRDYHASIDASLHTWKQRITRTSDLPRNSLNFFMSQSKVEEQREEYIGFKEEISPVSWAIEAVVGAVLQGRGCGFRWAASWYQIRAESAPIWRWISLKNCFKIGHDLRHDRPRSGDDRAPDSQENADRWSWNRFHVEGSTIAVRSDRDRGVLPRIAYTVGLESDAPEIFTKREKNRTSRGR